MRHIFFGVFLALISFSASAGADPFRWTEIGGDPCSPKAGCNPEWALSEAVRRSGWPTQVRGALLTLIKNEPSRLGMICEGWIGWMTWGKHVPKFKPLVLAAWPEGHCESMKSWEVRFEQRVYIVAQIDRCGNWGGWIETVPTISRPEKPKLPLGYVPTVYCE